MPSPVSLDEALHLYSRASPSLRRYAANVASAPPGPLFASPDAARRASVCTALESSSAPGDPTAPHTCTAYSYMFAPTLRSVPGRAAWAACAGIDGYGADQEHDWLAPIVFDEDGDDVDTRLCPPVDPPTSADDPWTPPARRPGEGGGAGRADLADAVDCVDVSAGGLCCGPAGSTVSSSSWSGSGSGSGSGSESGALNCAIGSNEHLIYGGIIASHIFDGNGGSRLVSGRCLIEPKTGDTLGIMRQDDETVTIVSIRVTGTSTVSTCLRRCTSFSCRTLPNYPSAYLPPSPLSHLSTQ
jgi:hypothetical protein